MTRAATGASTVAPSGAPAGARGAATGTTTLHQLLARTGGRPALDELARVLRPDVPTGPAAGIPVPGPLGTLLPAGRLAPGVVVGVDGLPGSGRTAIALQLAAAATADDGWAAVVDPRGELGGRAALEAGVDLGHLGVVRGVTAERWPTVVAALLDGVPVVLAEAPTVLPTADARRLLARARERRSTLVVLGPWPERTAVHLRAVASTWYGLDEGEGLLGRRLLTVEGEPRAGRPRRVDLVHDPVRPFTPGSLTLDAEGRAAGPDTPDALPAAGPVAVPGDLRAVG